MRGWAIDLEGREPQEPKTEGCCIGVVCADKFPEPELIVKAIKQGAAKYPDATWVIRETDKVATWAMEQAELEFVPAPLNPWYKHPNAWEEGKTVDSRRVARTFDMLWGCEQIVAFVDKGNASLTPFIEWASRPGVPCTLHVVERGAKKTRARKGRKVEA